MERFIGFETIPSISKVIIYHWVFYTLLTEQIIGDVPLDRNLHIFSFTLQKNQRHEHGGCMRFQLPPCFGLNA